MRHLVILAALGVGLPALAQESIYVRGQVGWIFSGSAGISTTGTPDGALNAPGVKMGKPFGFGAAVGWDVGDGFRVEGAFDYRNVSLNIPNDLASVHGTLPEGSVLQTTPAAGAAVTNKSSVWNVMVNAIYDLELGADQPFYPYIGVGVGWASAKTTAFNTVSATGAATNGLNAAAHRGIAYNLLAGVAYEFSDTASVYVEYKYFGMLGKNVVGVDDVMYRTSYKDSSLNVGVKFGF